MLPKDATIAVSANGKTVNVKVQAKKKMKEIAQKFEAPLSGNDAVEPFYDPTSAVNGNLEMNGVGEYQQYLYEVSDDAEQLNTAQIAHRVKLFAKVVCNRNIKKSGGQYSYCNSVCFSVELFMFANHI